MLTLIRRQMAAFCCALLLAACGEDPVSQVKSAVLEQKPDTPIGRIFSGYGYFKNVVWESYKDDSGEERVRVSCEYDVTSSLAGCPRGPAGEAPAARVFLNVLFALGEQGHVVIRGANFQTYSEKGYFEEYQADPAVIDNLLAGKPSATCEALYLPSYL